MAVKLEAKSKRCVVIRLKIKGMWITFIPVYGLTYDMDKKPRMRSMWNCKEWWTRFL